MAMLGLSAYMTIEPGNGTLEEQIVFTGVVQNSNGTATLTGVSNVSMQSPYTQTSGLMITHAGATTAVLSNTSGFYSRFVAKDDDGVITETLTFTNPEYPRMDTASPSPTDPQQLVTKAYADSLAIAGAPNASTSVNGIVQVATQAQVDSKTIIGSTSAVLVQPLNTQRSTLLSDYIVDTGSPNVIIITPSPSISSYIAGQTFSLKLANTNTSPTVSINVSGLGAKNLSLNGTASPNVGDVLSGQIITVEYDGTNFQLESPVNHIPTGTITMYGASSAPNGYLLCNGSPVSRTTFSSLFAVIGTAFGIGDGTTTFNVPALGGRFVAGPSAFLSSTIGVTGGNSLLNAYSVGFSGWTQVAATSGPTTGIFGPGSASGTLNGNSSPSIIPPYIILNYIVKT